MPPLLGLSMSTLERLGLEPSSSVSTQASGWGRCPTNGCPRFLKTLSLTRSINNSDCASDFQECLHLGTAETNKRPSGLWQIPEIPGATQDPEPFPDCENHAQSRRRAGAKKMIRGKYHAWDYPWRSLVLLDITVKDCINSKVWNAIDSRV